MKTPLAYHIDEEACINCGSCRRFCPVDAIPYIYLQHQVNMEVCTGCTICYAVCPVDAVEVTEAGHGERRVTLDATTMERVRAHVWLKGPFYEQKRRAAGVVARPRRVRRTPSA
jgi:ferredoxin